MAITDDAVEDDGETPTLTLSNAPGAGIADGTATGTIRNAEESSDPLTTSFESVPAEHDGSRAFSFRVRFSEDVKVSYRVLRDEAFIVSGGTVTNARPVGGRNDRWEILLQRDGPDEINVTLLATSSCDDAGAICISDGRPLSNSPSATVAGPPAISGTAGGRAAAGFDVRHCGRRQVGRRGVRLPVDPRPGGHRGRDGFELPAGGRRRGGADQGPGDVHR